MPLRNLFQIDFLKFLNISCGCGFLILFPDIFFKLGFTPDKAEQSMRCMKLLEKEEKKIKSIQGNCVYLTWYADR